MSLRKPPARRHRTTAALCLSFAALFAGATAPAAGETPPAEVEEVVDVEWEQLVREPGTWLGRRVRFVVQVQGWQESWNPYLTRFGCRDWRLLRAWSDEQLPWVEADWEHPAAQVFVRRGSAAERRLGDAEPFRRIVVEGVVREVLLGRPWLEVDRARPLALTIPEGTVLHAERALDQARKGAWKRALSELERALLPKLPPKAERALLELKAACEARIERPAPERSLRAR